MDDNTSINAAILERLEKVVESLQDNSVKMGQLLAVHNEKLNKQERIDEVLFEKIDSLQKDLDRQANDIKKGCERDIRLVDSRLRMMEKKMWSLAGGLAVVSLLLSPVGQRVMSKLLTADPQPAMIVPVDK